MEVIGLFMPGMISVWVKHKRDAEFRWDIPKILFEYGIYVLANVFITGCIITYVLGMSGVTCDALNSFPFFTKYTIIAVIMALLIPFVEEIITKYIKVTLSVRMNDEKK